MIGKVLKVALLSLFLIGFANADGKGDGTGDNEPIEVGNYVWLDSNQNGIQDSNENGIANINVKLVCNGVVEDQTSTNSDGYYSFYSDKITSGNSNNCKIVIENQRGICNFEPTIKDAGNDDNIDSDAYMDSNDSIVIDIPDSIDPNNGDVDNLDFGFKPCPVCIGDYVWNDSNKDGIQDANEEPLSGVWVSLYDENGDKVANMQTGNDGKYQFCELYPGEKYYVEFIKPGFTYSPKDRGGDDTLDSDVNINGKTDLITIGNSNNNSIDAGMYEIAEERYCLGNVYWLDENLNGIKDSNEKGVPGIVVKLYDENRKYIAQTTTDSKGEYKFCNLKKGKYYLHFDLPDGYMFINKNQSKVDSNGWSPLIDLNGDKLDLNAGIYCGCDDYKANPQNHKKLKLGVSPYVFVIAILLLIRVTFKKD